MSPQHYRLAYQVATAEVHTPDVTAYLGDPVAGIRLAAEIGYDGVEFMMRDASPNDPAALARVAEDAGIAISMCCTGEVYGEDRISFTDPDAAIRAAAIQRALGIVEFAAHFGVDINVGRLRGRYHDGVPREETQSWAREAFVRVCDRAADLGNRVLLEPLGPRGSNFLNRTDECVAYVGEIGRPAFGLMLDIAHIFSCEEDLAESVRLAAPVNHYVHVTDSGRQAPGMGDVDFAAVAAALRDTGYDGWVAVEIRQRPDSETAMRVSLQTLRRHF